jgi:hypothetical protein
MAGAKGTQRKTLTITSSCNEKISVSAGKYRIVVRGDAILCPPLPFFQQASRQIFKDDVNGFFLHLGYLLHGDRLKKAQTILLLYLLKVHSL